MRCHHWSRTAARSRIAAPTRPPERSHASLSRSTNWHITALPRASCRNGTTAGRYQIWREGVPGSLKASPAPGFHGLPLGALGASLALWGGVFAYSQPRVQAALRANATLASQDIEASKRALLAISESDWPPRIAPYPDSRERYALKELARLVRGGLLDALPPEHWYRSRAFAEMRRYRMFRWVTRDGQEDRALAEALARSEAARDWLRKHPGEPRYLGRWDPDTRKLVEPVVAR